MSSNNLPNPDPGGLMQALEELDYLAALDNDGNLSEVGIIMSEFPLDPQMSKTLLASCEFDCVSEVVTVAAMLTGKCIYKTIHAHKMYKYNLAQSDEGLHVCPH